MAAWEWEETYLVNISRIDTHHQKIVALFNSLYTDAYACQNVSQKQLLIEKALAELIDYSYYHMAAEEELMFKYEYPGYVSHKKQHEHFKLRVTQFMEAHKDGTLVTVFPILHFIKEWFMVHIVNTDKQCAQYLNDQEVK